MWGMASRIYFIRSSICAVLLILPTFCMGATLPAISRWFETSNHGVAHLSWLYAINIAGATFGIFIAGFYLMPNFSIHLTNGIAVVLNVIVASVAFMFANKYVYKPKQLTDSSSTSRTIPIKRFCIVTSLSGFTSLGAQIIWTRIISTMIGVTTYTFTIILGIFLIGLALGSYAASYMIRHFNRPKMLLMICQLLIAPAIAYAAYMTYQVIPTWIISAEHTLIELHKTHLICCLVTFLPCTFLWGASFPLTLASVGFKDSDPGRVSGYLYAANTFGAIIASLGFSLFFVPTLGTQIAQWIIIAIALQSAFLMLRPTIEEYSAHDTHIKLKKLNMKIVIGSIGLVILGFNCARHVLPITVNHLAFGVKQLSYGNREFLYVNEGISSNVAVQDGPGSRSLHISGKVVASTYPGDILHLSLLGHLPGLIHGDPKSVLIVGMGTGVTSGSFIPLSKYRTNRHL